MEISKIWIKGNIFGLYLKPYQIKICEMNNILKKDSIDSIKCQDSESNNSSYILSDSSEL